MRYDSCFHDRLNVILDCVWFTGNFRPARFAFSVFGMANREVAAAIVIDSEGRLLLQQRDNIRGILYPGMVGLFGGHREGAETFLECAVRELHEELSYFIPPERFEPLWSYDGPDWVVSAGDRLRAEYFVVRDVPIDQITVTEGSMIVVEPAAVTDLTAMMTPATPRVMDVYFAKYAK